MYLSMISMQLVLAFLSSTNGHKHPTRQRGHHSINQHRSEDRQAQSPSFATHNFEPLYRADSQNSEGNKKRPNIILILTDDQDIDLGSLQFMPKLARHMSSQGTTFNHGFVSTPMCCPSRSSLLTGLYVHNHEVYTNNDNCSSPYWVQEHEPRTFATYLQDSGYSTAYFGKYLNKYQGTRVPAGWGEWQGLIRNSRFYNYTLNVNGKLHHHGFNYEKDYLPDIIANRSMNFLRWSLTSSPDTPVLAVLSYPGPHGPEDSAPQYQHLFHNVTTHHTPAYNLAPNPDKQWILRETGKMAPIQQKFTDMLQTKRLQTLQSVDDGVERVVNLLQDIGELDNTYLFYTSDHGYHLGQYGLVKGKAFPFDVDTHVPLIVRGPGVPANVKLDQPVVNIDLAPTFLDAGGLKPPPHMDGRSMLDVFRLEKSGEEEIEDIAPWRSAFLIERGKMTLERYMKVSAVFNSSLEGSNPLFSTSRLTKRERVEIECKKPRYQLPCQPNQKWYCKERKDGVMKMRKCAVENENGEKCRCNETVKNMPNWKYTKLAPKERKDQKSFLRRHVTKVGKIRSRFLKMKRNGEIGGFFPSIAADSAVRRRRWRRQSAINHAADETSFEGLLHDVAEQEIQEVDTIVQDITDQLRDLHVFNVVNSTSSDATTVNSTHSGNFVKEDCYINMNNVVCTPKSRAELSWEESRQAVRQQIQRLRAQLHELKQIRRYLHVRRPKKHARKSRVEVLKSMSTSINSPDSCTCGRQSAEVLRRRQEKKVEKLRRKQAKKQKLERKLARKLNPRKPDHCKADVKMNCFSHDNSHWRTPPLWTEGPFCACTNSNNNTYWCVRNINSTHNYLYCEYVTGMVTYFDLKVDPHQLRNVLHTLSDEDINYMHHQVTSLREFSAAKTFLNRLSVTKHHEAAAADGTTNGELRGDLLPMDDLNISPVASSMPAAITDDFTSTAIIEAPVKSSRRKSLRRRSQRLEQRLLQLLAENSAISSDSGGGGKKRANIKLLQRKIRQRKIERLKRRNGGR